VIVVDANILLRFLTDPETHHDVEHGEIARRLFERAMAGTEAIHISDAVVAEVIHVLMSPSLYRSSRAGAASGIAKLLQGPGFRNPHKEAVLDALTLWEATPALSFVDALSLSHARALDAKLATFDRRLTREAGDVAWAPS
jgi:predicted nucleic acid-binding protein